MFLFSEASIIALTYCAISVELSVKSDQMKVGPIKKHGENNELPYTRGSQTGVCGSIANAEFHSILTLYGLSILTIFTNNNILVIVVYGDYDH